MIENKLKQKLLRGESVVGPFCKLNDPAIAEIAGHAGFDYIIIDMEHGPYSFESAQSMIRACDARGITPVIRVSENNDSLILRALDIGAHGVQVPQVSTVEDARKVVRFANYHPVGERGMCRYVRAADYSTADRFEYFKNANQETLTIIHIEGLEGSRNLKEILTVEGIDVIFLGPYDLSQSCGVPGQVDHPLVIKTIQEAIQLAGEAGKFIGTFVESPEAVMKWEKLGIRYFSYSVDVGIIAGAFRSIVSSIAEKK